MSRIILISVLMFIQSAPLVEHAPTTEQCRADEAVWAAEDKSSDSFHKPSGMDLINRRDELAKCHYVDPDNKSDYDRTLWALDAEMRNRFEHFLIRHDLLAQFVAEDA